MIRTDTATAADWLRDMAEDHTAGNPRIDAAFIGAQAIELIAGYLRDVADVPDDGVVPGDVIDHYWREMRMLAKRNAQDCRRDRGTR